MGWAKKAMIVSFMGGSWKTEKETDLGQLSKGACE